MQNQREEALEPPGLACNGLTLGYDGRPVIEGLDLSLPPGASLAIVGESGCGKSTLLTALAGLRPSISGTVRWTSLRAESVRFRTCAQASSGSISVFFRGSA